MILLSSFLRDLYNFNVEIRKVLFVAVMMKLMGEKRDEVL